jgi:radical SAM protein with 4Fe4S-binding SPASM domain
MNIRYLFKEAKYYYKLNGFLRALKKFLLTMSPLKKIVNTTKYNKYYEFKIKKQIKTLEPTILQIENTNLCNAKCIMCPHTIMKRKNKTMSLNEFKHIIDNVLESYRIKKLVITGFGEPFADKRIIDKIDYVNKKYPYLKLDLFTNASLLDNKTSDELIKRKIERITFSINSTKKNYHNIVGLDYENTKNNVLYFLKQKKLTKNRILVNVSLMILKENEKDIKEFVKFWGRHADSVRVYTPSNWAGNIKFNYITKNPIKNKRWPCFVLWNNITVDVEGNIIMCCRDYESVVKFGNLLKEDIKEIRKGKKFKALLENHMMHKFNTSVCSRCDNSFDSSLDWVC